MNNKSSYTAEETAVLRDLYAKETSVEDLAEILNKTTASIRSKLVKEGIYIKSPKVSSRKTGPGKKELVREIEKITGLSFVALTGANKVDLMQIRDFIIKLQNGHNSN